MVGRNIVVSFVIVLAVFAAACSGGSTAPTPTPTPGIISSITLAQVQRVEPAPLPSGEALSYVYGVDSVTAHFTANIAPSDSGLNTIVMACLGVDAESYIGSACKGKGTTAISSGVIEGVTLGTAYSTGPLKISSTLFVHVFVINASIGQQNAFSASLTAEERARTPFSKLRASGLLVSEPTNTLEPINWKPLQ
jgi:hypothetical protein